jgi:hypothetical protein
MTVSLQEIERLEFRLLGILSRPAVTPGQRQHFGKRLSELRAVKKAWLAEHPTVLRKIGREPLDRDKPNARHPDGTLGERDVGVETRHFRAPAELAGLSIASCRGVISIPPSGIIETNAAHEDLHAELRGRGFKEMRPLDRFGKAVGAGDLFAAFRPDRLQRIFPAFAGGQR